ncbi:diguanylate cyclase [Parahaliea maris]|uniref:diguanylate cyclase n=1 Tax=Parahaliea maris TaxID=2716870 RepID=A0A5C9A6C3_9GAMM|nr:diguanylate cyclase [Parahaliea maris]TXS96493.1 diguanylate cyclase [Parahaliea maris]
MEGSKQHPGSELDLERVQILYDNVRAAYIGVSSAIALLYFITYSYATPALANLWLLCVAIANIPRLWLSLSFARHSRAGRIAAADAGAWDRYMAIASVIAYAGFVAVIFLPFGEQAELGVTLCAYSFMVLATGGVLVLGTSYMQMVAFLSLVMFSVIIRFVMFQQTLFYILAAILCFGYVRLLIHTRMHNRVLVENIALKIENRESALIDPLTRLGNRRRLAVHMEVMLPAAQRSGDPFCVMLLDIDYFKQFNDTQGHSAGDELLVKVAEALRHSSREQDLVVRYGGEEFLAVLPRTTLHDARAIAERMLNRVRETTSVTISAGLAEYHREATFEALVTRADEALYAAKDAGRDRCMLAQ